MGTHIWNFDLNRFSFFKNHKEFTMDNLNFDVHISMYNDEEDLWEDVSNQFDELEEWEEEIDELIE